VPFGNLRIDYPINLNDTLEFDIRGSGGTRGEGRDGDLADPPHRRSVRYNYSLVRWKRSFAPDRERQIQAYFNNYFSVEDFSSEPVDLPGLGSGIRIPFKWERDEERLDVEARCTVSLSDNMRTVLGWQNQKRQVSFAGISGDQ